MRFKLRRLWGNLPLTWRITLLALAWLVSISGLHQRLNCRVDQRPIVSLGYMPVVTNLSAPLLDHVSRQQGPLRFEAIKFASFAEMAEALRNDRIQAAFMIAPLSIVLHQQGEDVKIVYIGNRHESTLVVRKDLPVSGLADLAGRTIAVPMRYSGHHLSLLQLKAQNKLSRSANVVEMNPPDMASALVAGSLDAYFVGEPFAAQTLKSGDARLVSYVEDIWRNFICNLVLVKGSTIDQQPEAVMQLVQTAVRAGIWAQRHPKQAAELVSSYWNQPPELIEYALTTPTNRIVYNRYVPLESEIQYLADMMMRFDLIPHNRIQGLVTPDFALNVITEEITDVESILTARSIPPSLLAATQKPVK